MEEQRNITCIEGQEMPTWTFVWRQIQEVRLKIEKLNTAIAILGLAIIILAIAAIATRL